MAEVALEAAESSVAGMIGAAFTGTTPSESETARGEGGVSAFEFDAAFQTKIAAFACRDDSFLRRCGHLIRPEFFENMGEAILVRLALDHYRKYRTPPDKVSMVASIRDAIAAKIIRGDTAPLVRKAFNDLFSHELTNVGFVEDKVVEFARHQAVSQAILKSVDLIGQKKFPEIEAAVKAAIDIGAAEEGDAYDFYDRIKERTEIRLDEASGKRVPQGITTGIHKMDELLYHKGWGRRELATIMGGAKAGKCVTRDTLIFTGEGLAEIGKYVPQDMSPGTFAEHVMPVLGMNGMEHTSHIYNSGMTPTIRIKTAHGLFIEGTHHHPVLTLSEDGEHVWKRLDEIKLGDFIVGQRGDRIYGHAVDLSHAVESAARRRAESKHADSMNDPMLPDVMTPELAEWLAMVVAEGALGERGSVTFTQKDETILRRFVDLTKALFDLECGVIRASGKTPCARVQSVCLQAYLEALGLNWCVSAGKTIPESVLRAPRECVLSFLRVLLGLEGCIRVVTPDKVAYDLTMASKTIIRQVQMLLLNEGVVAKYSERETCATNGTRIMRPYFRLQVSGSDIVDLEFIGSRDVGKPICDRHFYAEVQEITRGQAETVDLTVPGTHSFFANGLVSHNTSALINFAKAASMAGHNVLYVTLEVGANIISDRLDASMTSTLMKELNNNIHAVREAIEQIGKKSGKLILHEYPSGTMTPNMLRKLIDRYKSPGWMPGGKERQAIDFDLIVVDYADIMAPNHRTNDSIENSKSIYVDLRAIAFEYNVAMLTATQTNREGYKAAVAKAEHVAEDFNKVRTVDLMISINKTEEEAARGEARLYFAASRNQESGFTIVIKQNLAMMQFCQAVLRVE